MLVAPEHLHEQRELVRPKLVRPLTGRNLWAVMRNRAVRSPYPNPITLTLGPNSLILALTLKALILSLNPILIVALSPDGPTEAPSP